MNKGCLLVYAKSDRWIDGIQRVSGDLRIQMVSSFKNLFDEINRFPNGVVVLEIPNDTDSIVQLLSLPERPPVFALGEAHFRKQQTDLIQIGFSECFWTTVQLERLIAMANRYFQTQRPESLSIEEAVHRELSTQS